MSHEAVPHMRAPAPLRWGRVAVDVIWRAVDVATAAVGLVFVAPLLVTLLALIWFQDGGAPLFAQTRIGLGGRTFRCFKLRTMCVDSEARLAALLSTDACARDEWARDHKLRRDPRITRLGRF